VTHEPREDGTLTLEAEAGAAEAPALPTTERLISGLLRVGVASSLALVVLGMLVMFTRHPDWLSSHEELRRLTREPITPHSFADVLAGLGEWHGRSLTMVGLLLLMGLPVARVALSLLLFAQQKDRVYVAITSTVLALLVLSFVLGRVAH
jgi:uncharacterized membrane protein